MAIVSALFGWGMLCAAEDEPSEQSPEVAQWVRDLGDEKFAVREKAREKLLATGTPALPLLTEAMESDDPEQRIRATQLVNAIRSGLIRTEFAQLTKRELVPKDVEHGMWLIAMILDPGLPRAEVTNRLDAMAASVRKAAGEGVEPAGLAPDKAVSILIGVLKNEFGLHGDMETYDHPDNSSIHRVLTRKKGLPIVLSEIAVAVGRRVDLPVVGLGIPGRYMFKYDGSQAPEGEKKDDIIVNPFEDWKVTTAAELTRTIPLFDRATDLEPYPPRLTLIRILNNLAADFVEQRDLTHLNAIREYQELLAPPLRPAD